MTSSIFVERFQNFAVSDGGRHHIMDQLERAEVIDNFGGQARLDSLRAFLAALRVRGVPSIVISHGLLGPIRRALERVQLGDAFDAIYASDSPELQRFGQSARNKALLIQHLMATMNVSHHNAYFLDDTQANLTPAEGVCQTILVRRGGYATEDMVVLAKRLGFEFS